VSQNFQQLHPLSELQVRLDLIEWMHLDFDGSQLNHERLELADIDYDARNNFIARYCEVKVCRHLNINRKTYVNGKPVDQKFISDIANESYAKLKRATSIVSDPKTSTGRLVCGSESFVFDSSKTDRSRAFYNIFCVAILASLTSQNWDQKRLVKDIIKGLQAYYSRQL